MLRSFDYAAAAAIIERTAPDSAEAEILRGYGEAWADANRDAFWSSYLEAIGSQPILPAPGPSLVLRRAFEVQKAVYEIGLRARAPAGLGAHPASLPPPGCQLVTIQDPSPTELESAVEQMLAGRLHDPHELLGPRTIGDVLRIRAFHPEATSASVARPDGITPMRRLHAAGLFEATVPAGDPGYRIRFRNDEREWEQEDPYRFLADPRRPRPPPDRRRHAHPALASPPAHASSSTQGVARHRVQRLGAECAGCQRRQRRELLDARTWPMRTLGTSGVWELFTPGVGPGVRYKFPGHAGRWDAHLQGRSPRACVRPPRPGQRVWSS